MTEAPAEGARIESAAVDGAARESAGPESVGPETAELARTVCGLLATHGYTIGVAESLTGGLLAAALVSVPGASAVFRGAVVAYATDLKHSLLGVDAALLAARGAVDPDVARQMADGVRRRVGSGRAVPDAMAADATAVQASAADVGVSTTGIAGPVSPDGQPVGTVHIGVHTPEASHVVSLRLDGDRDSIRAQTVRQALLALCETLQRMP